MKVRKFEDSNYVALFTDNGKTFRFAIDKSKDITELKYPEFYDVKITSHCKGECPECYMDSKTSDIHTFNLVENIHKFFGSLSYNQRPFQVAIGGGEPTESPGFISVLEKFYHLDIVPNYTTNGMFVFNMLKNYKILEATKKYCGGVAVSCHPHLYKYWKAAVAMYAHHNIKLNLHIIISDSKSILYFKSIYEELSEKVDHFVLLPYVSQGRAVEKDIDWDFLVDNLPKDCTKIAYGAGFHKYIKRTPLIRDDISLYPPEIFSKFLDMSTMKVYPRSFDLR